MEVFFYGLFMDVAVLSKNGIQPRNPRKGYLDDYALKIGHRASLIPSKKARSYGIVMTVDWDALHKLYKEDSVADYLPEEVSIVTEANTGVKATCYNLPAESLTGTNPDYVRALYKLAKHLGFPDDYLDQIAAMMQPDEGE